MLISFAVANQAKKRGKLSRLRKIETLGALKRATAESTSDKDFGELMHQEWMVKWMS